jgi:hypothetical protein
MKRHTAISRAAAAACTVLALTSAAGCQSSSGTAAGPPNTGITKGAATSTPTAASGGSCAAVTAADVTGFFTGPVAAAVAGTDGNGPGSKDCFYPLQGSSSDGFHLSTHVDLSFWKGQFSTVTPISGVADPAWYANNGLLVMVQKGAATCMDNAQFSSPSQVTVSVDGGGAVAPAQRDQYTQKLAALCIKALG